MSIKFEKGEMNEGIPWAISYNEEILVYDETGKEMLCKHAYYKGKDSWLGMPEHRTGEKYCIPRSVICHNEGGYNSTILCLDCLLEQIGNLEKGV